MHHLPKIPRKNNFDFLRFLLAFSVFGGHFPTLIVVAGPLSAPLGYIAGYAVHCFFIISGFLIVMSYENSKSLKEYCLKRICRIYPAYCFIILTTAFGLCFLSKFSWQTYFVESDFFEYIFYNLVFLSNVQQSLPGVFTDNPSSVINGPFWTIKIEVLFYASVPILVFLFRKFNKLVLISLIYIFSYIYFSSMIFLSHKTGSVAFEQLSRQLPGQLSFFVSEALLYYYFNEFKKHAFLSFSIAVAILVVQNYLSQFGLTKPEFFASIISFLLPISLGVITIFIAFFTPYLDVFSKYGDISYGIYIFHFPIIQTFTALKLYSRFPYFATFVTVIIVIGCAFLSWHFVEKPFLSRKNHYRATT